MNSKDIQNLKKKLLAEKKGLEDDLAATGRKNPDHPGDWEPVPDQLDIQKSDENEVADQLESFQGNQVVMDEFEKRYHQVLDALENIEKGTYGLCKICGKPIEMDRLEANPAATTCIEHKNS